MTEPTPSGSASPLPHLTGDEPKPMVLRVLSATVLFASACLFYVVNEVQHFQNPVYVVAAGVLVIIGGFLQIAWLREQERWRKYRKENAASSLPSERIGSHQ